MNFTRSYAQCNWHLHGKSLGRLLSSKTLRRGVVVRKKGLIFFHEQRSSGEKFNRWHGRRKFEFSLRSVLAFLNVKLKRLALRKSFWSFARNFYRSLIIGLKFTLLLLWQENPFHPKATKKRRKKVNLKITKKFLVPRAPWGSIYNLEKKNEKRLRDSFDLHITQRLPLLPKKERNLLQKKEDDEKQREEKTSFRINYSSSLHHASYILHLHA